MCGLRINFFFLPLSSIASGGSYCHKHSNIVRVCKSKGVHTCLLCGLRSKVRVCEMISLTRFVLFTARLRCVLCYLVMKKRNN